MTMILTSNGLSSSEIINEYKQLYEEGYKKVAIVVTADPVYREKDIHAIRVKEILEGINFEVSYFDIDFRESRDLLSFDIIYFIGGNPYYLLEKIRKTKTESVLKQCLSQSKVISGASAGCIVLGDTIKLVDEFDCQLNEEVGITDLSGIKLSKINVCPHYSQFLNKYKNFEKRICQLEKKLKTKMVRINDGEAIILNNENTIKRI